MQMHLALVWRMKRHLLHAIICSFEEQNTYGLHIAMDIYIYYHRISVCVIVRMYIHIYLYQALIYRSMRIDIVTYMWTARIHQGMRAIKHVWCMY